MKHHPESVPRGHGNSHEGQLPPRIIAWELTRACNLKCVHCRATAVDQRDPSEYSTTDALALIQEIADYCQDKPYKPMIILTGGEPLVREDIFDIAEACVTAGFRTVMAPNGTLLTEEIARRLKELGVAGLSISVDAADAEVHDVFRGVDGAFIGALQGMASARSAGLPFQINSTITRRNRQHLPDLLDLAVEQGARLLDVFMLVPTGRGEGIRPEELTPEEYEDVIEWVYEKSRTAPIGVKTTCAPHYTRVFRQKGGLKDAAAGGKGGHGSGGGSGCMAGTSFMFISHVGEVYPCGYFPVPAGSLREDSFEEVWENSPLFNRLRDRQQLQGKCGDCEFRTVCGGCRARALSAYGDYMHAEPLCTYVPKGHNPD